MRPPCHDAGDGARRAVHGYGDANAGFHLIGDHPGRYGGLTTGVPFTETDAGEHLQSVFSEVGFLATEYDDEPKATDLFMSYLYACVTPEGRPPTEREYAELERFFDAELRAISADVLMPVGERATEHVLEAYSAQAHKLDSNMAALHGTHVRGRGFLIVPIREPTEWEAGDRERLVESIRALLDTGYEQLADLGRFVATNEPYWVR